MQLNWRERTLVLMTITPAIAATWLQLNNRFNRHLKPSVVEQYARDLLAGRWVITHQGIAFDWNGQLIDGQHRLAAIVKAGAIRAGIAVQMYVSTGYDPLFRINVDTHSKRSVVDAFSLSQRQTKYGSVGPNSAAGMWSRMMYGISSTKGRETRQEIIEFADRHREAGTWALMHFGRWPRVHYVQLAPVMAAVARAYYHINDLPRLAKFVEVLSTGIMDPGDKTAVKFRNALAGDRRGAKRPTIRGNSNAAGEIYGKTCNAIKAFVRRDEIERFCRPAAEPFPLPEDMEPPDSDSEGGQAATRKPNRIPPNGGQLNI